MPRHLVLNIMIGASIALAPYLPVLAQAATSPQKSAPQYDAQGRLKLPGNYREWVFLSSGLDMSYSKAPPIPGAHMFNNVFVPKPDYDAFLRTGHWPNKTVLLLENRGGTESRSILRHGEVQTQHVMGLEAHVKDTSRFKGGWGFFAFDDKRPAEAIAYSQSCYSCHALHGAVDTTFVQFYPTLLPVAEAKHTLKMPGGNDRHPIQ